MATNFPGSADSFTNPSAGSSLSSPSHADQHTNVNDAVEAIETALLDGAPLHIDDTNERVGIGTASPAVPLDVEGHGRFVSPANGSTGTVILRQPAGDASGTHVQFVNNANSAQTGVIHVSNAGNMDINATGGKVGINMAPQYGLDVSMNTSYTTARISDAGYESKLELSSTSAGGQSYAICSGGSGGAFAGGDFGVWDVSASRVSFRIDSTGGVTMPATPRFLIYSSGHNVSGNSWQDISLPTNRTVDYNVGNHWNSSNGLFYAPVTGYYLFYAGGWANYNGSGNRYGFSAHINVGVGGDWKYIGGANTSLVDTPLATYTVVRYMVAGEYMRMTMFSSVAMILGTSSHKFYYGGHLLG